MLGPLQETDTEAEKVFEPLKGNEIDLSSPTRVTDSSRDLSSSYAKGGRVEMKNDVERQKSPPSALGGTGMIKSNRRPKKEPRNS